jgi:AraC-like DNA-binding protein
MPVKKDTRKYNRFTSLELMRGSMCFEHRHRCYRNHYNLTGIPLWPQVVSDCTFRARRWLRHRHTRCAAIVLTLEGTTSYYVGGKQYTARQGDVFLVLRGSNTRVVKDNRDTYRELLLALTGPALDSICSALGFREDTLLKVRDPLRLEKEMRNIAELLKDGTKECNGEISGLCYKILFDLGEEYRLGKADLSREINAACTFIHQHLEHPVTLRDIAKAAGTSGTTLWRKFKKELGQTVHRWLLAERMKLAEALLSDEKLGIKEVASKSGFPDAPYFSTQFRKRHGMNPSMFRKTNKCDPPSMGTQQMNSR